MAEAGEFLNNVVNIAKDAGQKLMNVDSWKAVATRLSSNEAINEDAIENSKGIAGTILRTLGTKEGTGEALSEAVKGAYTKAEGGLDLGAIAGSYIGVSTAYRIASGGGLYKDKNGNTNIAGIPFI